MCLTILRTLTLPGFAKPGKDATRPGGLRPIGLTHPVSKALCAILRDRITPRLADTLRTRPQFAYTQGRGTMEALLRAHGHMQDVQSLIQANRKSIYPMHAGAQQHQCVGGLTFSLDLEVAFDAVPRSQLARALTHLGIEDDIVHLLMLFHRESRYHFRVGDAEACVTTTCGIKQSCRVAPYLFIALTIQIMGCLATTLGAEWLREGFTFYADDALAQWQITSAAELRAALRGVQAVIDAFNLYGMTISSSKSVLLIEVQGTEARKTKRVLQQQQQQHKPGEKTILYQQIMGETIHILL